jgi:CubicO group peptidase (beta-lactamase class C family)
VNGEVIWAEGFGLADLEHGIGVWPETKFRIGSVSKPYTAAAVGLLVQQGRLDLDAPVQQYVPSFPEKRWPVTTRQLAGHLAGVRHYDGEEFLSATPYTTVLEGLEMFQDDTLQFEPGTRFSYSSFAWNLISAVVEGASGQQFLAYMQEMVFDPLGMTNTVADYNDSIIPHRARPYVTTPQGVVNAPYVDNSYKWAGGGFLSTPTDMVRFGMGHIGGGFLSGETLETLWMSQRTNDGEETGYGIGWTIETDRDGHRMVFHGGGSIGGTTFLLLFPDDGIVVSIVGNARAPMSPGLAWTLAEPFLTRAPAADPEASAPSLAGAWECSIERRGEQVAAADVALGGEPGDYWGQISIDDDDFQIVFQSGSGSQTRLIAVNGGGGVLNFWLSPVESGAEGSWLGSRPAGGDFTCSRQ